MRRILTCGFLLIILGISPAAAVQLGIGGYAGGNIPIIQEDQGTGTIFGFKGKFALIPGIALEPNINFAKFGNAEFEFGTREGSKVTSYGVDAILGSGLGAVGFKLYGFIGGGLYSIKRDYDDDMSKIGWSTGLGFEIGLSPSMGIDVRGKMNIIGSEGGGTKKSAAVTGGLNLYLGM